MSTSMAKRLAQFGESAAMKSVIACCHRPASARRLWPFDLFVGYADAPVFMRFSCLI